MPFPSDIDYGRSLVTQMRGEPASAGVSSALTAGLTSAAGGALLARLLSDDPLKVALAALLAGGVGGTVGYMAGRSGQEAENSRLLALRRTGIDKPSDLEFIGKYPGLSYELTRNRRS